MIASLKKIYISEGVKGFFKGNVAGVIRIFPFTASEFYFYELLKNIIIRGNPKRQKSYFYNFICGGCAGWISNTLTYPLEVARTRLGASTKDSHINEHTIKQSLVNLWKNNGLKGFFRGFWLSTTVKTNYKLGYDIFCCY